jgi:hypothetical protein
LLREGQELPWRNEPGTLKSPCWWESPTWPAWALVFYRSDSTSTHPVNSCTPIRHSLISLFWF